MFTKNLINNTHCNYGKFHNQSFEPEYKSIYIFKGLITTTFSEVVLKPCVCLNFVEVQKIAEEAFLLWQRERGGCLKSQKTNHPARPNGKRLAFLGI